MNVQEFEPIRKKQEESTLKGGDGKSIPVDLIVSNNDPKDLETVQIGPFKYHGMEGITITKIYPSPCRRG